MFRPIHDNWVAGRDADNAALNAVPGRNARAYLSGLRDGVHKEFLPQMDRD